MRRLFVLGFIASLGPPARNPAPSQFHPAPGLDRGGCADRRELAPVREHASRNPAVRSRSGSPGHRADRASGRLASPRRRCQQQRTYLLPGERPLEPGVPARPAARPDPGPQCGLLTGLTRRRNPALRPRKPTPGSVFDWGWVLSMSVGSRRGRGADPDVREPDRPRASVKRWTSPCTLRRRPTVLGPPQLRVGLHLRRGVRCGLKDL